MLLADQETVLDEKWYLMDEDETKRFSCRDCDGDDDDDDDDDGPGDDDDDDEC